MSDLRTLREAVALLSSTDFDLATALASAVSGDDAEWMRFCSALEVFVVTSRDVLTTPRTMKCEAHNAMAPPPTGSELRCHVWVIAGYAGWKPRNQCRFVPVVVLEVTE